MMFKKKVDVIEIIQQESGYTYTNLDCCAYEKEGFNYYMFVMRCSSEDELRANWERLSNDIALYFQSLLEKSVEIWNMYIFFFVDEFISKEIKYKIEQDKYSTRKIVFDGQRNLPELEMIKKIQNTIFNIDKYNRAFSSDARDELLRIPLKQKISETNNELIGLLDEYAKVKRTDRKTVLDKYISKKGDQK